MRVFSGLLVAGLIIGALLAPGVGAAAIVPIGGRVVTTLPCVGGGLYFTVVGFGIGSGAFVWYPGSLTYPYGLPRPGVNILGTADVPTVCMVGKVPFPGLRVFMEGTSLSI